MVTQESKFKYFQLVDKIIQDCNLTQTQLDTLTPQLLETVAFTIFVSESTGQPSILRITHPLLWQQVIDQLYE